MNTYRGRDKKKWKGTQGRQENRREVDRSEQVKYTSNSNAQAKNQNKNTIKTQNTERRRIYSTRSVQPCSPPSADAAACAAASQVASDGPPALGCGLLRSIPWNKFSQATVRPE